MRARAYAAFPSMRTWQKRVATACEGIGEGYLCRRLGGGHLVGRRIRRCGRRVVMHRVLAWMRRMVSVHGVKRTTTRLVRVQAVVAMSGGVVRVVSF